MGPRLIAREGMGPRLISRDGMGPRLIIRDSLGLDLPVAREGIPPLHESVIMAIPSVVSVCV